MKPIDSFRIDHTRLAPGLYVSRRDRVPNGWVTTFDVRLKRPNREPAIHPGASHTIEHVVATYLRNSPFREHVVYWGPMGCLTGFYFLTLTKEPIGPEAIEKTLRAAFRHLAGFKGKVPGATAASCGNCLLHDLPMARWEAERFLACPWAFAYPVAKGRKRDEGRKS